jgi:nucleotide-binding universal stress UspA family protein
MRWVGSTAKEKGVPNQGGDIAIESEGRIVVGVDGSKSSLACLEWAVVQAEKTGTPLEVIMTWEWPASYGWAAVPEGYDPGGESQRLLDEIVASVKKAHPDVHIGSAVVEGHPAPILVKASEGAELLVVGSRGHGQFAGMLLGSVSEHCVTNAHCPVLVFRDRDD